MVTDKKMIYTALARYRLGNVLVTLGVLTWLPFIILRMAGERPPLFWFLPFHLAGVIGGSRLRSLARSEMGALAPKRNSLRMLGHILIYAGILVWLPYIYLKLSASSAVNVMDFLPYHLSGVLGGILVLGLRYWVSRKDEGTTL
jgi:hypothetical protein